MNFRNSRISAALVSFVILTTTAIPVLLTHAQETGHSEQQRAIAGSNLRQLRINRRLWNRQNISNYRYTLINDCFCGPEFRGPLIIEVRNRVTTSITNANTGQPVNPELLQRYNTIPKLFNLIRNSIYRGESELTVEYNPKLGYPTKINIGNLAADAGTFTTVKNLEEIR